MYFPKFVFRQPRWALNHNKMSYYRIHEPKYDDYEAVIKNGFAYTGDASGYTDLIKKGYPKPSNPRTILAELYSVNLPPILWATLNPVWICAFLVTDNLLNDLREQGFNGFEAIPVEIAKVATKGKVRSDRKEYSGEPEDLILKRKNLLKELKELPTLWGIAITGEMALKRKDENSQGRMQPFVVASESSPDLFYTTYNNKSYGKPILCSERLRAFLIDNQVDNITVDSCSEIWLDTQEV
jgi:hypothetical protein